MYRVNVIAGKSGTNKAGYLTNLMFALKMGETRLRTVMNFLHDFLNGAGFYVSRIQEMNEYFEQLVS